MTATPSRPTSIVAVGAIGKWAVVSGGERGKKGAEWVGLCLRARSGPMDGDAVERLLQRRQVRSVCARVSVGRGGARARREETEPMPPPPLCGCLVLAGPTTDRGREARNEERGSRSRHTGRFFLWVYISPRSLFVVCCSLVCASGRKPRGIQGGWANEKSEEPPRHGARGGLRGVRRRGRPSCPLPAPPLQSMCESK
jgi:hypothetical protein